MKKKIKLIVIGTKPKSGKGGISTALSGYLQGLDEINQPYLFVDSHRGSTNFFVGLFLWFKALLEVKQQIKEAKIQGYTPILWLHLAAWFSIIRKSSFAFLGRSLKVEVIAHFHSVSTLKYIRTPYKNVLLKWALSPVSKIFALTPWWKETLFNSFDSKLISVIPNPIDNDLLALVEEMQRDTEEKDVKNIFSMSRLVEDKGFEELIESMRFLDSKYVLTIAGDGPLLSKLKQQVIHLNLASRVKFTGWINLPEKVDYMQQSDVFCLPSKNDSFGMVFIEAMACYLPVVALDAGAISDVVSNKVNGILVKSNAPQVLAKAIVQAYEQRDELGCKGKEIVNKKYTSTLVAHSVLSACK